MYSNLKSSWRRCCCCCGGVDFQLEINLTTLPQCIHDMAWRMAYSRNNGSRRCGQALWAGGRVSTSSPSPSPLTTTMIGMMRLSSPPPLPASSHHPHHNSTSSSVLVSPSRSTQFNAWYVLCYRCHANTLQQYIRRAGAIFLPYVAP